MESEKLNEGLLHGSRVRPEALVGRRLEEFFASWHRHGEAPAGPLDVWLIDSQGGSLHITTGSHRFLMVAHAARIKRSRSESGWLLR